MLVEGQRSCGKQHVRRRGVCLRAQGLRRGRRRCFVAVRCGWLSFQGQAAPLGGAYTTINTMPALADVRPAYTALHDAPDMLVKQGVKKPSGDDVANPPTATRHPPEAKGDAPLVHRWLASVR